MLELVFVIIILGIVSSIGAEIIASVYESYIIQRATHRSSIKTELAATQIANRLTYAVPGTVIGRISDANSGYRAIDDLDLETYKVMQWMGYDADSFGAHTAASRRPGWSGLSDIDASNVTSISTPGSQLDLSTTIIDNLSNGTRDLSDAALFFASTYNPTNISYTDINNSSGLSNVASGTGETITLDAATGTRNISELYKLSWSSYAVVPVQRNGAVCTDPATQVCDLHLRYNFQPWNGIRYNDNATSNRVLLRNVTVFRFTGTGNTVRFKICQRENIGDDYNITTCKEKAVIR